MSQPKRPKVDAKVAFGVDNLSAHVGDIPARQPVAGTVRYVSREAVEQGIKSTLELALYPVVLQPTQGYRSLNDALMNTSIPPTDEGKRVRAVVGSKTQQLKPMLLATCFEPLPLSSDGKLLVSSSLIKTLKMHITNIIEVVKVHTEHWSMEKHKESFDQELLVKICSSIMWDDSVILRECRIDNKCLPHGSLDIVCGYLGTEDISIKLSVMVDDDETTIDNPQLVSAKTRFTLKTKELNSQIVVEGLSFGEVITNPNNQPYIFLGATREAFRVFIRASEDILLTTTGVISWWTDNKPNIEGISALVLMILCASGMAEDSLRLSAETIKYITEDKNYPKTGWTAFYERCGFKYGEMVFTQRSTAKFENNSQRQDAIEHIPKDDIAEEIKLAKQGL